MGVGKVESIMYVTASQPLPKGKVSSESYLKSLPKLTALTEYAGIWG